MEVLGDDGKFVGVTVDPMISETYGVGPFSTQRMKDAGLWDYEANCVDISRVSSYKIGLTVGLPAGCEGEYSRQPLSVVDDEIVIPEGHPDAYDPNFPRVVEAVNSDPRVREFLTKIGLCERDEVTLV